MFGSLIPTRERLPRPLVRFEEEMENFAGRFFGGDGGWSPSLKGFAPQVDIVETDSGFEVSVDLPGMKAEDFLVEILNGSLWISGEKHEEKEEKDKTYHRIERHYGEFRRVLPLGGDLDEEKIEATYTDGVLKVSVPKTEEAMPKKIEVKS